MENKHYSATLTGPTPPADSSSPLRVRRAMAAASRLTVSTALTSPTEPLSSTSALPPPLGPILVPSPQVGRQLDCSAVFPTPSSLTSASLAAAAAAVPLPMSPAPPGMYLQHPVTYHQHPPMGSTYPFYASGAYDTNSHPSPISPHFAVAGPSAAAAAMARRTSHPLVGYSPMMAPGAMDPFQFHPAAASVATSVPMAAPYYGGGGGGNIPMTPLADAFALLNPGTPTTGSFAPMEQPASASSMHHLHPNEVPAEPNPTAWTYDHASGSLTPSWTVGAKYAMQHHLHPQLQQQQQLPMSMDGYSAHHSRTGTSGSSQSASSRSMGASTGDVTGEDGMDDMAGTTAGGGSASNVTIDPRMLYSMPASSQEHHQQQLMHPLMATGSSMSPAHTDAMLPALDEMRGWDAASAHSIFPPHPQQYLRHPSSGSFSQPTTTATIVVPGSLADPGVNGVSGFFDPVTTQSFHMDDPLSSLDYRRMSTPAGAIMTAATGASGSAHSSLSPNNASTMQFSHPHHHHHPHQYMHPGAMGSQSLLFGHGSEVLSSPTLAMFPYPLPPSSVAAGQVGISMSASSSSPLATTHAAAAAAAAALSAPGPEPVPVSGAYGAKPARTRKVSLIHRVAAGSPGAPSFPPQGPAAPRSETELSAGADDDEDDGEDEGQQQLQQSLPTLAVDRVPVGSGESSDPEAFMLKGGEYLFVPGNAATGQAPQALPLNGGEAMTIFPCEVCGKVFTRQFNLRSHMRTHSTERPYVCTWPHCTKAFSRKHDAIRHHKVHTVTSTSRPIACPSPACTRRFSRESALDKHLKASPECLALVRQIEQDRDGMPGSSSADTASSLVADGTMRLPAQELPKYLVDQQSQAALQAAGAPISKPRKNARKPTAAGATGERKKRAKKETSAAASAAAAAVPSPLAESPTIIGADALLSPAASSETPFLSDSGYMIAHPYPFETYAMHVAAAAAASAAAASAAAAASNTVNPSSLSSPPPSGPLMYHCDSTLPPAQYGLPVPDDHRSHGAASH